MSGEVKFQKWNQELPTDFAKRLRRLRASDETAFYTALAEALNTGWTQRAIGKGLGVGDSAVSRWAKRARPNHGIAVPLPPPKVKRRPGRPATGKTPSRSLRIGDVYDQAKAKAEAEGTTITAVVERLLAGYVAE